MTAIFPYDTWVDITRRGTSGDQVHDILASWKQDAFQKMQECESRDIIIRQKDEELKALRLILARVRQVGDHLMMTANNPDATKGEIVQAVKSWDGVSGRKVA